MCKLCYILNKSYDSHLFMEGYGGDAEVLIFGTSRVWFVDVTLFFGGGGGGTTYFICGKTSSSRVPESDGLFICFGGIINV